MILAEPVNHSTISSEAVNKAFGKKFRELRRQRDLSQSQCGDLLDLSRVTIANMESGKQNIQLHQIFAIAQAFDVRVEGLVPSVLEVESADVFSGRVRSDLLAPADVLFLKLAQGQLTAIMESADENEAGD